MIQDASTLRRIKDVQGRIWMCLSYEWCIQGERWLIYTERLWSHSYRENMTSIYMRWEHSPSIQEMGTITMY